MKKIMLFTAAFIVLNDCNNNPKKENQTESTDAAQTGACYSFDNAQTQIAWTAYKFTEAVGVKGKFNAFEIEGTQTADNAIGVFEKSLFKIPVNSISTGDTSRDRKIQQFFFGTLNNTTSLSGKVDKIEGDGKKGKFFLTFTMNDMDSPLEMEYTLDSNTLTLSGLMVVDNWNAQAGIQKLNEECKQLHTGADGKSVLWPEVKLEIQTVLNRNCN